VISQSAETAARYTVPGTRRLGHAASGDGRPASIKEWPGVAAVGDRPPPAAVSTLLRDDSHFEGAIAVARGPDAKRWLEDDPFARIFPGTLLEVERGLLGRAAAPTGPTIERYGSGNPWPWDRFW
jgi:hypothetical protein